MITKRCKSCGKIQEHCAVMKCAECLCVLDKRGTFDRIQIDADGNIKPYKITKRRREQFHKASDYWNKKDEQMKDQELRLDFLDSIDDKDFSAPDRVFRDYELENFVPHNMDEPAGIRDGV